MAPNKAPGAIAADSCDAATPPPPAPSPEPMPIVHAILVRLAMMTHQHAVARAAVAHLLLARAAEAAAAGRDGAADPRRLAPPTHHYARVLSELPTHPRVLVSADDDDNDEDEAENDRNNNNNNNNNNNTDTAGPTTTTAPAAPTNPLAAAVLRFHAEAREAQARARLRALRANDVGAYLALLKGAREGRLRECFAQSERVMAGVLARLPAAAVGGVAGGGGGGSDDNTESEEAPEGAEAQAAWERLAARIRAAGVEGGEGKQPAMLGGGGGGDSSSSGPAAASPPPQLLRLRSYQLEGMRWMVGLKRLGLNGILADEMGLGKTVQVLAAVCRDIEAHAQRLAAWAADRATAAAAAPDAAPRTFLPPRPPPRRPALVLCPASVLPNWVAEAKRWAPGLRVLAYTGPAPARDALWAASAFQGRGGGGGSSSRPAFDLLLVSYETLMGKRDFPRLASLAYGWLVVDEGHRVKNAGCRLAGLLRQIGGRPGGGRGSRSGDDGCCRVLLTGTPLQMDLGELWSLLDFLMPGAFGSSADFDAWFSAPLHALREAAGETASAAAGGGGGPSQQQAGGGSNDSNEAALLSQEEYLLVTSRLHRVLRPFVLRRVKEGVAGELPRKEEHVLACGASPYEAALCALVRLAAASSGGASSSSAGGRLAAAAAPASATPSSFSEAALAALRDSGVPAPPPGALRSYNNPVMELRSISNHPIISRLHGWASGAAAAAGAAAGSGDADDNAVGDGGLQQLLGWGGGPPGLHHPYQEPPLVRLSGKFEVLDRLLARLSAPPVEAGGEGGGDGDSGQQQQQQQQQQQHGHRVLIFSTMTRALDLAAALLERRGLAYLRLDGATATDRRGDLAAQFASASASAGGGDKNVAAQSDAPAPPFAFLLSVRAGGVGLNLQAADSVIMLDSDPNPQADLQAQARAHRLGQEREVRVYRLLSRADGCEAHVARRCDERLRLAAAAVDAGLFDGRGGDESEMERRGVLMGVLRQPGAAAGGAAVGARAQPASAAEGGAPFGLAAPSGATAAAADNEPPTPLAVLEAVAAYAARAAEAAERAGPPAAPTDDELNAMVARSPEELAMLRRRFPPSPPAAAAAAAAAAPASPPLQLRAGRLATASECAALIRRACEASLRPRAKRDVGEEVEADPSLYGRGMRRAVRQSAAAVAPPPPPTRKGKRKHAGESAGPGEAIEKAAAVEAAAVELEDDGPVATPAEEPEPADDGAPEEQAAAAMEAEAAPPQPPADHDKEAPPKTEAAAVVAGDNNKRPCRRRRAPASA